MIPYMGNIFRIIIPYMGKCHLATVHFTPNWQSFFIMFPNMFVVIVISVNSDYIQPKIYSYNSRIYNGHVE